MTTEVILYRNPGEQAMWNVLMGPFGMWLVIGIVSAVVGAIVYAVVEGFAFKRKNKVQLWLYHNLHVVKYTAIAAAIAAAIGTFVAIAYPIW